MKFERLELERFGHFESLALDLRGPSGLVFRRPDGTIIDPPPFAHAA